MGDLYKKLTRTEHTVCFAATQYRVGFCFSREAGSKLGNNFEPALIAISGGDRGARS
jgi:hypothetical protein